MHKLWKLGRFVGLIALILIAFSGLNIAQGSNRDGSIRTLTGLERVVEQFNNAPIGNDTRVIVMLNLPETRDMFSQMSDISREQTVASAQARLRTSFGDRLRDVQQYRYLPLLAATVDVATYQDLLRSSDVASVQRDRLRTISLAQSTVQIGAPTAWSQGFDGSGQSIAILDTGVDKNHPFFGGRVVREGCFATHGTVSGFNFDSPCPGNNDSTAAGSGVHCTFPECNHGTHVAGIAAGNGVSYDGVARAANLIAVQVFSGILVPGECPQRCPVAFDSDVIMGMEYVYTLRTSHNVAAVNLSLGGGGYADPTSCDADNPGYRDAVALMTSGNVASVAASGNDGYLNLMSSPACVTGMISVGSVGTGAGADQISNFSNTSIGTSILAPGFAIDSSVPGNQFATLDGTSMAAPHVAGAIAVLREKQAGISPRNALKAMRRTGLLIFDPISNRNYRRLNLAEALDYLNVPNAPTLISPAHRAEINSTPNVFTFNANGGPFATSYKLFVLNPASGAVVTSVDVLPGACGGGICSATLPINLIHGRSYQWFVQARGEWRRTNSETRVVVIDYPGEPTLTGPAHNRVFTSRDQITTFSWTGINNVDGYILVVRNLTTGQRILRVTIPAGTTSYNASTNTEFLNQIRPGRVYGWQVVAFNELGESASARFKFTFDPQ
ncbi:MAG: S8 family serine peptidase [Anaerolineae bacterium]|jgi:subtilisin family serine protease|nr:S8 family serine peptidase [Anaerolineae bacterium]